MLFSRLLVSAFPRRIISVLISLPIARHLLWRWDSMSLVEELRKVSAVEIQLLVTTHGWRFDVF